MVDEGFEQASGCSRADSLQLPITHQTKDLHRSLGFLLKRNAKLTMMLVEQAFEESDPGFVQFIMRASPAPPGS